MGSRQIPQSEAQAWMDEQPATTNAVNSPQASMGEQLAATDPTDLAQAWMDERLAATNPADFLNSSALEVCPTRLLIHSVEGLVLPPHFSEFLSDCSHEVTSVCDSPESTRTSSDAQMRVSAEEDRKNSHHPSASRGAALVLIFVNPSDTNQVRSLTFLLNAIAEGGSCNDDNIMILIPHTVAPTFRIVKDEDIKRQHKVVSSLLGCLVDDAVLGEPKGLRLAYTVRARVASQSRHASLVSEALTSQQDRAPQLRTCIDHIIWTYLRMRLQISIPDIDPDIASGQPSQIHNFEIGKMLGQGASGKVFMMKDRKDGQVQAVKSIPKAIIGITCLKTLGNEIKVMQHLSSDRCCHPNITQLHEVHHSQTHVFLRMECVGLENLHQRLRARDGRCEEIRPLSLQSAVSIISQCITAVKHLHIVASVAHRDLKPGNIILKLSDDVKIKVSDFGLAKLIRKDTLSRCVCGTLPFMAPEIVLDSGHRPLAADVWSLGITLLEVLCFACFVDRTLLRGAHRDNIDKASLAGCVRLHFSSPDRVPRILRKYIRAEYEGILDNSVALLKGMLEVDAGKRSWAKDIVDVLVQ